MEFPTNNKIYELSEPRNISRQVQIAFRNHPRTNRGTILFKIRLIN
jgi:hypothetical protein